MEKNIEDYAHLYIGCTVKSYWGTTSEIVTLVGVADGILIYDFWRDETEVAHSWDATLESEHPDKLLLRPLSSMTEEEAAYIDVEFSFGHEMSNLSNSLKEGSLYQMRVSETFEITRYLLSKSFDLFGLIEAGLAIDSTKL